MLNDALRAKLEQQIQEMAEVLPAVTWSLFSGYKSVGFNEHQSLELTKHQLTILWAGIEPKGKGGE